MRIVMTLLVRDEVDVVESQILFHLNAGVDFVVATDHGSVDGTGEVLERFAGEGVLHLLRESGPEYRQSEWVTRMARLAATEFGADWVVNADADEFWWPRGGDLKEVLAAVPPRFDVVRGFWRHFVPRPGEGPFAERMTVRARTHPDRRPFNAQVKVVHRASPTVTVSGGNHDVDGPSTPLREWYPLEVLHFPLRTLEQARAKYRYARVARELDPDTVPHRVFVALVAEAERDGEFPALYDGLLVDEERLAAGLEDGTLAIDTRVRDVLRALAPGRAGAPLPLPPPVEDELYLHDIGVTAELDSLVRVQPRLAAVERRLGQLERSGVRALARRAARVLGMAS